jgi:nicotinamidase-related amidase
MQGTIKTMIDPADAVMLLIDHQSGLFQLVKDIDMPSLRHNVSALAKASRLARLPTFTTASAPDGPNGPLIPEIHRCNPDAIHIPRTGPINAWDDPRLVEAIQRTGRRTLLIAGTLTSVCMSFPTLSALAAGYRVFTIIDASGNWSSIATEITLARVAQAGAMPIDTYAVIAELMNTYDRADAVEFVGALIDHLVPHYRLLTESYERARTASENERTSKSASMERST